MTKHFSNHTLKMFEDNLDTLVKEYKSVFPKDWDELEIADFCCRYVLTNIEDIKKWIEVNDE